MIKSKVAEFSAATKEFHCQIFKICSELGFCLINTRKL